MVKLLAERVLNKGDELIFVSCESNLIFSLNMLSGNIAIKSHLQNESFFGDRLFGGIFAYKDKYIVIPANSRRLVLLDDTFNEETVIKSFETNASLRYMAGSVYKDTLFMFNHGTKGIRCVNLIDYTETELNDFRDCYFFDCFVENEDVFLPACNSSAIIRLNMDTKRIEQFDIGKGFYNAIEKYDRDYYLAPRNCAHLTIWKEKREIHEISIPMCNAIGVINVGGNIYLPSNIAGGSLHIDPNGDVKKWHSEDRFILSKRISENTYVLMNDNAIVYVMDLSDGGIREYKTEMLDDTMLMEEYKRSFRNRQDKKIWNEGRLNNLSNYLNFITDM